MRNSTYILNPVLRTLHLVWLLALGCYRAMAPENCSQV